MTIPEGAKTPTDHLPAAQPEAPVELTPGWELLKPMGALPAWDLLEIYAELVDLTGAVDGAAGVADQIRATASLTRKMLVVAIDADAYIAFASGKAGVESATNLAVAWMGELGKSLG